MIRIDKLSFTYPNGHAVLDGIDLVAEAGEKVALVGPNGAGKSTLLLHLNGILVGQGSVRIGELPVAPKTLKQVRAAVGMVFQDPNDQLFSPTVFEDVAFGPLHLGLSHDEVVARVEQALSAVGMAAYGERMPHYLSLGEKKRIAIATVLAMEPQALVLDEPSAGLDPRSRRQLIGLLQRLPQTMLIASHDMHLVWELCPRTVVLDAGRVVADGPTRELLLDAALMDAHGLETP